MGVYDQVKQAFQDIVAPEIQTIKGEIRTLQVEIRRLDEKMDSGFLRLDEKMDSGFLRLDEKMDSGFLRLDEKMDSGFLRLDEKIDGVDEKIGSVKTEILAEIRSLHTRLGSLEHDLRVTTELRERLAAVEAKVR